MDKSRGNSHIRNALLKYGYSKFSLEILEYCEGSETIRKEQKYLDLLNPEYNILKSAGSTLGFKHSKETIAKLKSRVITAEHISKLKLAKKNENPEYRLKRIERLKLLQTNSEFKARLVLRLRKLNGYLKLLNSKKIEIVDTLNNNKITEYSSITEAAQGIGCAISSVSDYLTNYKKTGVVRLLKDRYLGYYYKEKSNYMFPTP